MPRDKTPKILVVIISTQRLQWFVASVGLQGEVEPLIRSAEGDLAEYQHVSEDDQLSFLRHRLSGAMQKGCDRLWASQAKAASIVLIADGPFLHAEENLLPRLAEHLFLWMSRPPISCYRADSPSNLQDFSSYSRLAGEPDAQHTQALTRAIPPLVDALRNTDAWEVLAKPKA